MIRKKISYAEAEKSVRADVSSIEKIWNIYSASLDASKGDASVITVKSE
jgi:hypothetical protein